MNKQIIEAITFTEQPCSEAVEWLLTQPDLATAWNECERGDWMWWALRHTPGKLPSKATSVAFATWCADRARKNAAAYATAYATAATDATTNATDAAGDAAAAAAATNATTNATSERQAQADWIRENVDCPFDVRRSRRELICL